MQVNEKVLERTIKRFRERKILLPTFAQMRDPTTIPEKIKNSAPRGGTVGRRSREPVSHHLEERTGRQGGAVQRRELG